MPATPEETPAAAPGCRFYAAAMFLMLIGVMAAFVQKSCESAIAQSVAMRTAVGLQETEASRIEVQQDIRHTRYWQFASLAAVFLSMLSWGIALARREKACGLWAAIFAWLALYAVLQVIMV